MEASAHSVSACSVSLWSIMTAIAVVVRVRHCLCSGEA
jgi:hypothetical protein